MKTKNIASGFIFPAAVFLAAVVWLIAFYLPTRQSIDKIKLDLADLRYKIEKDVPEELIQSIRMQADSLSAVLEKKENRIYRMADLSGLGPQIQSVAKKYNLALTALKPKFESLSTLNSDTSEIVELPISIEMKGKFGAFTRLLDDWSNLPFVVRADGFTLDREDKAKGIVNFQIQGVVFLMKEKVNATNRTTPGRTAGKTKP